MGVVLVTGFEPFGVHEVNVTAAAARLLDGTVTGNGAVIVGAVVPVSYRHSPERLRDLVDHHEPACIVMLGLTPVLSCVGVERYARNHVGGRADADGVKVGPGSISVSGPNRIAATLDAQAIAHRLTREGVPAMSSRDAGEYVCNYLYYRVSESLQGSGVRVGFIHLPASADAAKFSHALRSAL